MITSKIVNKVKKFSEEQSEKREAPPLNVVKVPNENGQRLATILKANKDIVFMGTSLMDCMIGVALKEGRLQDHVKMSNEKAKELLAQFPKLTKEEKENIFHCVKEHHGVKKFHSIESEICCNVDCYLFASVKGFLTGVREMHSEMPLEELLDLLYKKADEKWNVLSLDICKKELKPEYELIKKIVKTYKSGQSKHRVISEN